VNPLTSPKALWVLGAAQAVFVAVAAFLAAPHTGEAGWVIVIAVIGVALSAVATYAQHRAVKAKLRQVAGPPVR
jgi:ABC-type Fe3+-siderophore transport system permease subunit